MWSWQQNLHHLGAAKALSCSRSTPCLYNPCPEIYVQEMQWAVHEERRMDIKKFLKTETAELADFGIIAASVPSHVSSRFTEVMSTLCANSETDFLFHGDRYLTFFKLKTIAA
jgi:hypothetical protein